MSATEHSGGGTVEYIQHHLTNYCVGDCDPVTHQAAGFWALNVDTVFVSLVIAVLMVFTSIRLTSRMTTDAPSGFQNAIETVLEFVQNQVRDTFPGHNPLIAPLALTIFLWVWLMNFMDLIPVDLLPLIGGLFGIHYMKVVPTTDLNTTLAMAVTVS